MTGQVCVQTWDSSNQGQDVEAHCGPDVGKCDREMNRGHWGFELGTSTIDGGQYHARPHCWDGLLKRT